MEDFYAAVEFAKKIEKSASQHVDFSDKIEIVKTLDFEPPDFQDLVYRDLVDNYERIEKIMSASKLFGQMPTAPATKAEKRATEEVESKVKEITIQSLQKAEELTKIIEEKPKPVSQAVSSQDISLLELERPTEKEEKFEKEEKIEKMPKAEKEEMFERPIEKLEKQVEFELEVEKEKTAYNQPRVPPVQPKIEREEKVEIASSIEETRPIDEKPDVTAVSVPAILETTTADEAAQSKYSNIEDYLSRELGGEVDYEKVRKKMLDLTKDLFKEKTTSGREKIKLEITVLKNMLLRLKEGGKSKAKTAAVSPKAEYSQNMLETLKSTQLTELSSIKDEIQSSINKQMSAVKTTFFDSIRVIPEDDAQGRKATYEKLVFDLTSLSEQLPQVLKKSEEFLIQKHTTELSNLSDSAGKTDSKLLKELESQLSHLPDRYKKEFLNLKNIISKVIDSITETAGNEVFGKEDKESKITGIVYEINETDEGTLLYYLHSKDSDCYKKYERNHISKGDAIHKAKILMAKEKGLSDDAITKYFGKIESED